MNRIVIFLPISILILVLTVFIYFGVLGPNESVFTLFQLVTNDPLECNYNSGTFYGRFSPASCYLSQLSYNYFKSIRFIFFVNLVEFIIFGIFLYKFLPKKISLIFLIILFLIIFCPAFTINFFDIRTIEDELVVVIILFIISWIKFIRTEKWIYGISFLIILNIFIYSKEIAFISCSIFLLSYTFVAKSNKLKIIIYIGLISILIFIVQYIYIVYGKQTLIYAIPQTRNFDLLITYIKVFINYSLFSDPIIWLMLIPFGILRVFKILINHSKVCIADQCLFAGCAYSISYLAIGVYGPYYLLPAYIFAIPTLYKLIKFYSNNKLIVIFIIILSLLNSIPYSLYSINYNLINNLNFDKLINYLTNELNKRETRSSIFIGEEFQSRSFGNYWLIAGFLYFKGIGPDKFDLKMGQDIINNEGTPLFVNRIFNPEIKYDKFKSSIHNYKYYPFTVFDQTERNSQTIKGDLVIIGPFSGNSLKFSKWFNKDDYIEIKFSNGFLMQDLTLKNKIKSLNLNSIYIQDNEIRKHPHYFVYIKK